MSNPEAKGCELCGDNTAPTHLHSRCHFTAPLEAVLTADNILELRCYVPDCNRVVARFRVTEIK